MSVSLTAPKLRKLVEEAKKDIVNGGGSGSTRRNLIVYFDATWSAANKAVRIAEEELARPKITRLDTERWNTLYQEGDLTVKSSNEGRVTFLSAGKPVQTLTPQQVIDLSILLSTVGDVK